MSQETDTIMDKILKKFKALKLEAEQDCKFELSDIDSAFNNTNSLVKWITKRTEWNAAFRSFEAQRKKQYRILYEFYCEEYPRKLNSKEEYALFIESDEGYNNIFQQCLLTKEIVAYCDSIVETLKSRGFAIKNAIEWQKFKNGQ